MDPSLRTIIHRLERDWRSVAPSVRRLAASLAAGLVTVTVVASGYAEFIESPLLRGWFHLRKMRPVPQSVSIVRIDKLAYDKVGRSPGELFPRQFIAEAVEKIARSGAKLIVLDAVAHRPADDSKADERLATALLTSPTVIARGSETMIDSDLEGKQRKTTLQHKPIAVLAERSKAVIPMEVRLTNGRVEQISLSSDQIVFSAERVPLLGPLRRFIRADLKAPSGMDYINFYGPPSTLPSVSLGQILGKDAVVPEKYFRNRVVFIGSQSGTGTGAEAGKDSFLTPVSSEWMFGVEIHATIAANLLDGSWLRRLSVEREVFLLGIVSLLASWAVLSVGVLSGALIGAILAAGWLVASYLAFLRLYYFLPALTVSLVILLLVISRWAAVATSMARRRKRRRFGENHLA